MGSPASLPQGMTQEDMWPAATAEGWKKPVLIHWQRTFDDALRVAKAKHQPILVAVNMDGEIASEHYAGIRYREPETATLMSAYACVVASVYRHTARDYDEQGRRVECPRFQTVTCGEHIEAERELYEKYFEGKRISPRHIVLGLDGKKPFDVYYSWDTATVFTTFHKGAEGWPKPLENFEPTLLDLVKSADVNDRLKLELTYKNGDRLVKQQILQSLESDHVVDQLEVLRSALFDLDVELARLARRALAQCRTDAALDLIAQTLQGPVDSSERQLLMQSVTRMAQTLPRARTLASIQNAVSAPSQRISTETPKGDPARAIADRVDQYAHAVATQPTAPNARMELAESFLARAQESLSKRQSTLLYKDAESTALEAERLGGKSARLDAVLAVTAAEFNHLDSARTRAVSAIEGGVLQLRAPIGEATAEQAEFLTAKSRTSILRLFAEARQTSIRRAFRAGESWPPEWLSDVVAAYSLLVKDPQTDAQLLADYYDFLCWLGVGSHARTLLSDSLRRFPDSPTLHERLRDRLLWEGGAEKLESAYAERLAQTNTTDSSTDRTTWFAGYASLIAAEHYRRHGKSDAALAAYTRSIGHYERDMALHQDSTDNSTHYVALAHAGCARLALERGDLDTALRELMTALKTRPNSAASADGLGFTPVATALMLKSAFTKAKDEARASQLQSVLDTLDPKLLEPPPSEQLVPETRGGRGRRGGATSQPASRPR